MALLHTFGAIQSHLHHTAIAQGAARCLDQDCTHFSDMNRHTCCADELWHTCCADESFGWHFVCVKSAKSGPSRVRPLVLLSSIAKFFALVYALASS